MSGVRTPENARTNPKSVEETRTDSEEFEGQVLEKSTNLSSNNSYIEIYSDRIITSTPKRGIDQVDSGKLETTSSLQGIPLDFGECDPSLSNIAKGSGLTTDLLKKASNFDPESGENQRTGIYLPNSSNSQIGRTNSPKLDKAAYICSSGAVPSLSNSLKSDIFEQTCSFSNEGPSNVGRTTTSNETGAIKYSQNSSKSNQVLLQTSASNQESSKSGTTSHPTATGIAVTSLENPSNFNQGYSKQADTGKNPSTSNQDPSNLQRDFVSSTFAHSNQTSTATIFRDFTKYHDEFSRLNQLSNTDQGYSLAQQGLLDPSTSNLSDVFGQTPSSSTLQFPARSFRDLTEDHPDEFSRLKQLSETQEGQLNAHGESSDSSDTSGVFSDWVEFLSDDYYRECFGEYPDFLYHIARNKYGALYFRVIRTLLLDKVLCSNRVSQMTKTYNDIEAVTRLLEEKEKDLELTARIGKELLAHNGKLETRVVELETELRATQDSLAQLAHDLAAKTELVRVLTNDADTDTGSENGTPTGLRCINVELMHRKVSELEAENRQLRSETMRLVQDTDHCEEEEARLIKDFTSQLSSANLEVDGLHDELERQKEENRLQNDRIQYLTEKLSEAEMRLHKFTLENEEVSTLLSITKENQCSLASELAEFKERYAEVMGLLREAQEQLRRQRKRGMPAVRGCGLMPSLVNANGGGQPDSLQSELESSLYSELSLDSGISGTGITPNYKKVFETVRCGSRTSLSGSDVTGSMSTQQMFPRTSTRLQGPSDMATLTSMSSVMSSSSQPRMATYQYSQRSSMYSNTGIGYLDSTGHSDNEDGYPGAPQQGMPGVPGAADLEAALRRLTPAEVMTRRAMLSSGPVYGGFDYDGMPLGCRTPDSIMSTGSSGVSGLTAQSSTGWKLPEKLQIVKPMEGSQTLHQWSQLATPTLSGLLEERPGVKIRGGRGLEELGMELYTLSDLEEDDEVTHPGKRFQNSGCVYTYTNSTVMHPDDGTSVTHSALGSQLSTAHSSRHPTAPPTPGMQTPRPGLSRRNSCSTFSTNMGLASMLNERGIKAGTPSCFNTPPVGNSSGINREDYTPTATPCNSPDGSPTATPRSMSPGPQPGITGLLSQGADLLWRTFASGSVETIKPISRRSRRDHLVLSRSEKKALTNMHIMEKVERMGLENIMSPSMHCPPNIPLHGAIITRRNVTSPMAQLTSLKGTLSSSSSSDRLSTTSSEGSTTKSNDTTTTKPPLPPISSDSKRSSPKSDSRKSDNKSDTRLQQLQSRQRQRRMTRPDLGTVNNRPEAKPEKSQSTFGTISSLFFGRKGGLL